MDTHGFFRNLLVYLVLPAALVVALLSWIAWRRDNRRFLELEHEQFEQERPDLPAEPIDRDPNAP